MKTKNLIALATFAITFAATLEVVTRYRQWKQKEIVRLQSESKIIETALGPVEFATLGAGPAVIVAHGSPGGYDQGIAFARLLNCNDFTFICVSRPGYLRTPLASGETPEGQADLYAALLDTLGIPEAAIIGISGGGPSTLQFAVRHANRCRGLVMVSAVTQHYSEDEVNRILPLRSRLFKQLSDRLLLFDPFLFLLLAMSKWLSHATAPEDLLNSLVMYPLRKAGYSNDMRQFDAISSYPLEQITVPTLIVHGTADIDLPFAHAQLLASKVPQSEFIPIEGGNHFSFITHQDIVLPALREFLQTLP